MLIYNKMVYTINKVIYGSFNKETASFQFPIDIKSIVRSLKVKQLVYSDDTNLSELAAFGILYSDLVQNNSLGIVNLTSSTNALATSGVGHQMSLTNDLQYIFKNPIQVSGLYTFLLKDLYNNIFPFSLIVGTTNHLISLVIEFECVE